mgnify:CR=1 FL=1
MEIKITSLENIREAARQFVAAMEDNTVFAFYGKMGAGKTTFVKAVCEELGVTDVINSPTFAIVNQYEGDRTIFHFDMYRIESEDDLLSIGFDDYLARDGFCLTEWSENILEFIPADCVRVTIEKDDPENTDHRRITISFCKEAAK